MKIIPTYTIWRVQDFHDLDKDDIIYRKINTILSNHFKGDEHISYREAKNRSDQIAKFDKNHHVYIGQVGYWLPWDPDPHELPEQEYQEKELNTLMSKYRENLALKDNFFEERNREKMDQALKENKQSKKLNEKEKEILNKVRETVVEKDKILNEAMDKQKNSKGPTEDFKQSLDEYKINLGTDNLSESVANISDVFETTDPWLQRKL